MAKHRLRKRVWLHVSSLPNAGSRLASLDAVRIPGIVVSADLVLVQHANGMRAVEAISKRRLELRDHQKHRFAFDRMGPSAGLIRFHDSDMDGLKNKWTVSLRSPGDELWLAVKADGEDLASLLESARELVRAEEFEFPRLRVDARASLVCPAADLPALMTAAMQEAVDSLITRSLKVMRDARPTTSAP